MLVDPSASGAGSTVAAAISQASQVTGTSFNYLLATARVESGLDPHAGAATSSAQGLFQFIEQTWLGTIKQSGAALGYGRYADAITQTASGAYQVSDPAMRNEILKLRNDPTTNAVMAGAFTKSNADILTTKLGRPPSEGELYIAHFLGVGGAARLISLAANDPNAKAADYFPNAASANRPIFYDRSTGAARSLAQVRNILTARYDIMRSRNDSARSGENSGAALALIAAAPAAQPSTAAVAATSSPASASPPAAPDTAGITSAFAAATPAPTSAPASSNQLFFHALFQDTDRPAPIGSAIASLWTTPAVLPPTDSGAPKQGTGSGGLTDLFKDSGQSS
jgi:hypothetical protein